MVNSKIFRAYDIRGIYPDEINESAVYELALALAVFLERNGDFSRKIIVGRDGRISSPALTESFKKGFADSGVDTVDIGRVSVDAVYFASSFWHLPAAMITASHNPKEWNGLKLMAKDGRFFSGEWGLPDLKKIAEAGLGPSARAGGIIEEKSIEADFTDRALSFVEIDKIRPMKIVLDAGSGMAGQMLLPILRKLSLEVKKLHFEPDGNFPHHPPDPSRPENLGDLTAEIQNGHFDFGAAFDGDGDRVIFVDESGRAVPPSLAGAIMSRYFMRKNPKDKIVYGVTVSRIVPETIVKMGGGAASERVGHVFISQKLKEIGGVFALESSGHYFFRDFFYADSGIIGFLVMLQILNDETRSLSALVGEFSKYVSIPETNFKVLNPEKAVEAVAKNFEGYETERIDGLSVKTEDFWFNLRPSNTEPLLRLNLEAKNEAVLERVKTDLAELIQS